MKTDAIDNDFLQRHIPNAIVTVEGEDSLLERMSPFIDSAAYWLESRYLGSEDFLLEKDRALALETVFHKAFAEAIPSLDVTLTPTGFGVVSTEAVSPASKERVERLIKEHSEAADHCLNMLMRRCRLYKEWRESERGQYFCATFLPLPEDLRRDVFPSYEMMRSEALSVERAIEERYLGTSLMKQLREDCNSSEVGKWNMLMMLTVRAVRQAVYRGDEPLERTLWRLCRPLVDMLDSFPDEKRLWLSEMGEYYENGRFKNNIKGAFYF